MNETIIIAVIVATGTIAAALIAVFAVPWAREHKDEWITRLVVRFAKAAEQTFAPGEGDKKLAYVVRLLGEKGIKISDPVKAAIEEAVYNISHNFIQTVDFTEA